MKLKQILPAIPRTMHENDDGNNHVKAHTPNLCYLFRHSSIYHEHVRRTIAYTTFRHCKSKKIILKKSRPLQKSDFFFTFV